jgi:FkbM family methyltransferase
MIRRVPALRQNVILEGRPFLTAARAALWLGHCALRIPATVTIGDGGPRMQLRPRIRHYGSTTLYMRRETYEPTLTVLAGLAEDGDTVLDVGANFGVYSLVLAREVGRSGRVFAFEPGEEALAQLRRNLALNSSLNVEVVPAALSDRDGTGSLAHVYGPPTYTIDDRAPGERVDLVRLDTWMAATGAPPPAIVKVDVEGHEPAVFAGGRSTLEQAKPLVMFEVSFPALRRGGYDDAASWSALAELGYRFFRLAADGKLERVDRVEEGNLFAVHPASDRARRLSQRAVVREP